MSVFCKLLNAEKKRVRTQCRLDFLRTCRHDRIIPYGFQFSKPAALGVTSTYFQDCWHDTLCRTSIELIDLVISETVLQLQNCSLHVETVSNEIIDATSLTEYFSVKRNVETLIRSFTSDIRARHRRKLLKFQNKPWIKSLKHVRYQQPDWWEPDVLRNRNPIDLVEVRPSPTMSVRHVVLQTQQTLQFPVREKDYPCDQIVIKAEASVYATCNTQQPGTPEEHLPPSQYTRSMTLRNNFVSQLEVCHSDFEVSAGTDIVPIESWQRTGGEADQQPSLLVTQSLNLHTQPSLISEISPTCSLSSMNVCSSGFCNSVTNDCSRKPEVALPALVEPLTIQVHSGYIARTTELIELRDDEFYTVINLSDYSLSYSDLRVLSLGLKFTPNPPHVDRLNLKESLRRFDRNLRLREYFVDSDSPVDSDTIKFRKKTTWTPPPNRDKALDMFISVVESELMNAPEQKNFPNLTADERLALRNLKRNTEVVIREADKGSAVVVMSRERYIAEANRQLSDTDVYKQVSSAVVFDVIEEVKDILSRLQKSGVITEDMATYAVPVDSKPARFYILPKVHKTGCPGRPIVSAVGSPTEGLSELVDHFIQPFVPNIPSYIRDTQDFLDKLHALCPLPAESILCTIDVTALYPSIPHDDGLANLRNALLVNSIPTITINGICDMTELVLKRNVFEFSNKFFIQTSGTAIGTKLAPGYANLFLSIFERNMLNQYPNKPSIWLRYVDDIFMIWNDSEDKLKDFLEYINTVHQQFSSHTHIPLNPLLFWMS